MYDGGGGTFQGHPLQRTIGGFMELHSPVLFTPKVCSVLTSKEIHCNDVNQRHGQEIVVYGVLISRNKFIFYTQRVWQVTSRLGTGKSINFFTLVHDTRINKIIIVIIIIIYYYYFRVTVSAKIVTIISTSESRQSRPGTLQNPVTQSLAMQMGSDEAKASQKQQ